MRWFLTAILLVHGLIHLMGPVKALGLAPLPQLSKPISLAMGAVWLLAAVLMFAALTALWLWPRGFWALALLAVIFSQLMIVSAWPDAKFGTLANAVILVPTIAGFLMFGPLSLHEQLLRDSSALRAAEPVTVTENDLARLPAPVATYLRRVGVVGQPRVQSYSLRFYGRIRATSHDKWIPFRAEQVSFTNPPTRLFWMHATKAGLPVAVYHRFVGGEATMHVKLLGAISMVDARGAVMDRSETVTLFNDMCILAPASLLGPHIDWEPVDAHTAKAHFSLGQNTITATLIFGDNGLLRDFISDDRSRLSADGKSAEKLRFSTPVRDYRKFGPVLLASHGEARWHAPDGDYAYGEFELVDLTYNKRR